MVFMDYGDYLQSDLWKKIRQRVIKRDGFKCRACRSKAELQVHHRSYDQEVLDGERDEKLITLCGECHTEISVVTINGVTEKMPVDSHEGNLLFIMRVKTSKELDRILCPRVNQPKRVKKPKKVKAKKKSSKKSKTYEEYQRIVNAGVKSKKLASYTNPKSKPITERNFVPSGKPLDSKPKFD